MRLLHTSDWHLGQTLHGQEREHEHASFLHWLLEQLKQQQVDVLLVAGDIFDSANPPLRAQELLYRFIVDASHALPALQIILIAGNHDSGARIELPAPLLQALRTHAVGRIHWLDDGELDCRALLIPLGPPDGAVQGWCLALPFLRASEITGSGRDGNADYLAAVAGVHQRLLDAARQQRQPGQALIAVSHAHMAGGSISADSERNLVIGQAEALPASLFPEDIAYVALGHLHRPQQIAGQSRIRYSGSPLPLSFSEVNYPHQVVLADFDGEQLSQLQSLPVPRSVDLLRIGPASLESCLQQLKALPASDSAPAPWLEVRVQLQQPQPDLRQQIEQALEGRHARLVRISAEYMQADNLQSPLQPLEQLQPIELFTHIWQQKFSTPPEDEVLQDFAELLQQVQNSTH